MSVNGILKNKKRVGELILFVTAMGIAGYIIFHGQNLSDIFQAIKRLSPLSLLVALAMAIFFVAAEGTMIFYLLHSLNGKSGLFRCISYSFIGFFYSGITPSATGGQPMQLYYMKKDGNNLADSSVVLMVVALIYKLVLVIIGTLILLFWYQPLKGYLQNYFGLYLLGLALNIIVVAILLEVMLLPETMKKLLLKAENLLEKIKVLKPLPEGEKRSVQFVNSYQDAIQFLRKRRGKIVAVIVMTFLQRLSAFFLTYVIYRGFGLQGESMAKIVLLQASIYIAVDMLPVPGAQGITELMYKNVFQKIFSNTYLIPSLYVTRGVNFYFLMIVSSCVAVISWKIYHKKSVETPAM